MAGFWDKLDRPFWALAPMEDVTDSVFRRIVASVGRPDVMFTEFTNVDAIMHAFNTSPQPLSLIKERGIKRGEVFAGVPALQRLCYSEGERPIVAQIWGVDPEKFYLAAQIIKKLKFDGVDINLGCPVKDVIKMGACSAMISENLETRNKVQEIIAAVREGSKLPVSVKTRIGFKKIVTEEWIGFLLEQKLAAITIHGRTAAEMSTGPAHWDEIGKAVGLRDSLVRAAAPLIIGNGDIRSLGQAREMVERYGVDGVMIGRGILENPGIFREDPRSKIQDTISSRINLLERHLELWTETWGGNKNFAAFKKYIKIYVRDFDGAAELRAKLMAPQDALTLERTLQSECANF